MEPQDWAQLCRKEAAGTRDPVTKLFLEQLADEFEDLAREERPPPGSAISDPA